MDAATGNEKHDINPEQAAELTSRYREQNGLERSKGFYFGKTAITKILAQSGVKGIRVYYGMTDGDKETLVVVGVDEHWNDLDLAEVGEYGISTDVKFDQSDSILA